jgi:hypothetical protein
MVLVPDDAKVDYDSTVALQQGVVALAGEPRARYVHCEPGAATDVAAAWREVLDDSWVLLGRDDAIAAGLFGPTIDSDARRRIGDVIALSLGNGGVVERRKLPRLSAMPGQHGSLTDEELLVPLLQTHPS